MLTQEYCVRIKIFVIGAGLCCLLSANSNTESRANDFECHMRAPCTKFQ